MSPTCLIEWDDFVISCIDIRTVIVQCQLNIVMDGLCIVVGVSLLCITQVDVRLCFVVDFCLTARPGKPLITLRGCDTPMGIVGYSHNLPLSVIHLNIGILILIRCRRIDKSFIIADTDISITRNAVNVCLAGINLQRITLCVDIVQIQSVCAVLPCDLHGAIRVDFLIDQIDVPGSLSFRARP